MICQICHNASIFNQHENQCMDLSVMDIADKFSELLGRYSCFAGNHAFVDEEGFL